MIFKNPYGYLIKHFKLIHLVLVALYIYLAIKVNSILQYYNHFILGTASKLDATSYISSYYLIAIIVSSLICVIVYALMRYKKKPRTLYLVLIILYILVGIMISVSYQGLTTISFSVLETKTLRLYRDLLRITILFQYISLVFVLVRALGFDVKKFNFVKDLEDLDLNPQDEEEIELALGGTESLSRRFHRRVRELRYYFLENKVFILLVLVVLVLIGSFSLFVKKEVISKEYVEGETFSSREFHFQVLNTFVTNKDVSNHVISRDDVSFVVVRVVIGVNGGKREFNTSNLILKINNQGYTSSNRYISWFSDLGLGYKGGDIASDQQYLFVYAVPNSELSNKMILEYAGEKIVHLSPFYLDKVNKVSEYRIGDKLDWSGSVFQSGYMTISSYDIQKQFTYTYQYEVMGKSRDASLTINGGDNKILHLVLDYKLPFDMTISSFFNTLGSLKYKIGENEFVAHQFKDKTPGSYKEGIYVMVDDNIDKADSIWFEFNVRGYEYIYRLK